MEEGLVVVTKRNMNALVGTRESSAKIYSGFTNYASNFSGLYFRVFS